MNKKTIEDINVKGKRVLVRCDFNVPLNENGNITDDQPYRRRPAHHQLPGEAMAPRVILCSHLGRPKGEVKPEISP